MGASVQSRSGVCLTAPAGLFQNFPKAKLMRHFVFQVRNVFNMTAKEGRKKSVRVLVAVGNGNGAAGFAIGKAADRAGAFRKAKNREIHYLHYIEHIRRTYNIP